MMLPLPVQRLAQVAPPATAVEYNPLGNVELLAWTYLALLALGAAVNLALLVRILLSPVRRGPLLQKISHRAWPTEELGKLLVLLLLLHAVGIVLFGIIPGTEEAGNPYEVIGVLMQSIAFQWAGLALVFASLYRRHISWTQAFGVRATQAMKDIGKGVLYYLAAMPFLIVAGLLWTILLGFFDVENGVQDIMMMVTDTYPPAIRVYLLIMAVALAPFYEEILFRGIALPYLAAKIKTGPALLVVSALFALIHFHLPSAVPLFIIAMAFGLAYLRTGSLLVPITMHMIFNSVNLILMFVVRNGP
ncbi:MAG: CPBP family intramembrane metalloprotease [Spartobacteria bacterium]|nr:CPBP family intramembrane metalloprotease [Spartobacteria bacterium]